MVRRLGAAVICSWILASSGALASVTMGVGSVNAPAGSTNLSIPITITSSTFAGFTVTLSYTNTVMEVVPTYYNPADNTILSAAKTSLSSSFTILVNKKVSGSTTSLVIGGFAMPGVSNATGTFLNLIVNVTGSAGSQSAITVTSASFADAQGALISGASVSGGSLTVTSAPPQISRSPSSLSPSCVQGQDAADQTFEVWNSAGNGSTLNYTIAVNQPWLSCVPGSGSSTGEHDTITVKYDTSSLAAGSYSATITISDPNASNSPQTVVVNLTVGAAGGGGGGGGAAGPIAVGLSALVSFLMRRKQKA